MKGEALVAVYDLCSAIKRFAKDGDDSMDPHSQEILQILHNGSEILLEMSKRTLGGTDLDDAIETECQQLDRIEAQVEDGDEFSKEEVDNLKEKIHSSASKLKRLEEQCADGVYNLFPDNEKKEEDKCEIVGLSDVYHKLKDSLLNGKKVTALVGMPGIGKTALAKKVFEDPKMVESFHRRVWVRVGKGCQFKDIPRRILAEMDPGVVHADEDDEKLKLKLKERLESERCLVVLDDVWDMLMAFLLSDEDHFLPVIGSRILVISRVNQLNENHSQLIPDVVITMRLMDRDESWKLLCLKVFSQESSPPELEKAGQKIAENCEGLPLTIVAVAALLSQLDNTPELWNEVAAKKNHQLFKDAYDQISEVLLPSYTYLPRILQTCFLFMGLFRQNYKIPRSKLINLWRADGFDEMNLKVDLDSHATGYLDELIRNSLVMVYQTSTYNKDHTVKTCGLHSSLWHLSNKKAGETKFSIVLNSLDDCLDDAIEGHRRLSFHSNVLFGIKDVHESVENKCSFTARSLLCYGVYHKYQVPLCYRLGLLRELDAVSIRFYEFPMEVLQLVELRYLTLTVNGLIPPSISKLSKLHFLILDQHLRIKSGKGPSYLPVEIWELKELKHLEVMGRDLPDPRGASLKSLSTLLNVSPSSCNEAVVKAIPNLKELRIRVELGFKDYSILMNYMAYMTYHRTVASLKCVVVNPGVVHRSIVPSMNFPVSLNKLSLSGLGYQWKHMSKIASLSKLKVLKLKNYAFRGPKWEVDKKGFPGLQCLVVEDTDMVEWQIGWDGFSSLRQLRMTHCYSLEKIHGDFRGYLNRIELVDCNP